MTYVFTDPQRDMTFVQPMRDVQEAVNDADSHGALSITLQVSLPSPREGRIRLVAEQTFAFEPPLPRKSAADVGDAVLMWIATLPPKEPNA